MVISDIKRSCMQHSWITCPTSNKFNPSLLTPCTVRSEYVSIRTLESYMSCWSKTHDNAFLTPIASVSNTEPGSKSLRFFPAIKVPSWFLKTIPTENMVIPEKTDASTLTLNAPGSGGCHLTSFCNPDWHPLCYVLIENTYIQTNIIIKNISVWYIIHYTSFKATITIKEWLQFFSIVS